MAADKMFILDGECRNKMWKYVLIKVRFCRCGSELFHPKIFGIRYSEVNATEMKRRALPRIANLYHWVLGLSLWYVFRNLEFLLFLLFLPSSPVIGVAAGCAPWLGAPLRLRPGAAEGGSRGDV